VWIGILGGTSRNNDAGNRHRPVAEICSAYNRHEPTAAVTLAASDWL
jgi:hypothetical protein